ncbi:MAG: sigma-70 family RNA polymerase sigma factor [Kiritimatiellae bacterium]|nr:sigma-70 family RNA polymerase sigma factor [Kiritimatiellia bacterium]
MRVNFEIGSDIKSAQDGDMPAFGRLVRQHEKMLLAFAVYRMPVREEAREAVQDTFIRAYEQIAEFRPDGDFGVWLRSICRYMILNRVHEYTRRRRKQEDYRAQLAVLAVDAVSGDEITDYGSDPLAQLSECLDKLNEQSQALIKERYHNTLSIHEISKKTGRTSTWVTSTLHRVRSVLKTCIEQTRKEQNNEQ